MTTLIQQELNYITGRAKAEYKSERAFYSKHMKQMQWVRITSGDMPLSNVQRKVWDSIVAELFTDYEYTIFKLAKRNVQMNMKGSSDDLGKEYNRLRIRHARYIMNNKGRATVNSSPQIVVTGDEPVIGTELKVEDELGNLIIFGINISSKRIPSGKKARLEWFNENVRDESILSNPISTKLGG